jgi:N,N'-diacetylchitobiose transport system substrate-binding protein
MRRFGIVAATALAATAALVLAGCAGGGDSGSSEKATIRVWLNGTDTPDDARAYLVKTFEKENPGSKLKIEEQSWTGIVDKLTTALSGSDSPDVVEVGNTQAPAFTTVGAFMDLTDKKAELGGKDLLPGFVDVGTADGKFYAAPYYAGSRLVFYRKDMFQAAGLSVPKTFDEYVQDGITLAKANPGVSGIYMPGKDQYNVMPYIWEAGGEIATEKGGKWTAQLSSDESVAGLTTFQKVAQEASTAPKDGDGTNPQVPFCANQVAMLSAPNWVKGSILAPADSDTPGCPDIESNLGVFALPGKSAGTTAQVFAGGSNIAVSNKSAHKDLAYKALKIMLSKDYQSILGKHGLVPALTSLADTLGSDETAKASAEAAANTKLTPASPKWADVEASSILLDTFSSIAQGADVKTTAEAADKKIDSILNG